MYTNAKFSPHTTQMDLLRDSSLGQTVRFLTGGRYLLYPEEEPGFTCLHTTKQEIFLPRRPDFQHYPDDNLAQYVNPSSAAPKRPY